MKRISEAFAEAKKYPPLKIAVSGAADEDVLRSVCAAAKEGIVTPSLFGNGAEIRRILQDIGGSIPCEIIDVPDEGESIIAATKAVSSDKADILMKGLVHSGDFLKAVLNKEYGLRQEGRSITTIAIMECPDPERLLFITDAGFIPAPDLEMKKNILLSTGDSRSKTDMISAAKALQERGYNLFATRGTADFLASNDVKAEVLNWPDSPEKPNTLDYIRERKIDLVINIPKNLSAQELSNDYTIRRSAIDFNVPLITNARLASAFIHAFCKLGPDDIKIKAWDEY